MESVFFFYRTTISPDQTKTTNTHGTATYGTLSNVGHGWLEIIPL